MTTKKSKVPSTSHLKKPFVIFGVAVIVLSILANMYGTIFSHSFITDPLIFTYYIRYIILLGAGFGAGYIFVRKVPRAPRVNRLFLGVTYAILAISLSAFIDILRVMIEAMSGTMLHYPWGKILFMGAPIMALIVTLLIAFFTQYKTKKSEVSGVAKIALIGSFIAYQLYSILGTIYAVSIGSASYAQGAAPWLIVGSYLLTPLVITLLAYLFTATKDQLDRVFYAVLVGSFYATLTLTLWEFRTDPTAEATEIFSTAVTFSSLIFTSSLLWILRSKRK